MKFQSIILFLLFLVFISIKICNTLSISNFTSSNHLISKINVYKKCQNEKLRHAVLVMWKSINFFIFVPYLLLFFYEGTLWEQKIHELSVKNTTDYRAFDGSIVWTLFFFIFFLQQSYDNGLSCCVLNVLDSRLK